MQPQEQTFWCWAATSASVATFFDRSSDWTQEMVASAVLGRQCCDEEAATTNCNKDACLDLALDIVSCLARMANGVEGPRAVTGEINAGNPLCVRVRWPNGGGHFLCIVGWFIDNNGAYAYLVQDPEFGNTWITSADLAVRYRESGRWTHSYFVRAPDASDAGYVDYDSDPEAVGG